MKTTISIITLIFLILLRFPVLKRKDQTEKD